MPPLGLAGYLLLPASLRSRALARQAYCRMAGGPDQAVQGICNQLTSEPICQGLGTKQGYEKYISNSIIVDITTTHTFDAIFTHLRKLIRIFFFAVGALFRFRGKLTQFLVLTKPNIQYYLL